MEKQTCGKCVYESRNDAKRAAGKHGGSRVYQCSDCGFWHLASARTRNHKKFRQQNRTHVTFGEIEMMWIALEEIQDLLAISEGDNEFGHHINIPKELAEEINGLARRVGPKVERIVKLNHKRQID